MDEKLKYTGIGINLRTLRDKSNTKVHKLVETLSESNAEISRIINEEDDDFIVTCNMLNEFSELIYDPIILANIKDIKISFFNFLKANSIKNIPNIKNLINKEGFKFYFASLFVVFLNKVGKNMLNRNEAKKILSISDDIEWNIHILGVFLNCIKPGEIDDQILNYILKNKANCLTNEKILSLLFEKIGKKNISKSHIHSIFNTISESLLPHLNGLIIDFELLVTI
nr:hypothetical protein [Candidatus Gracilibacteria bacterium]